MNCHYNKNGFRRQMVPFGEKMIFRHQIGPILLGNEIVAKSYNLTTKIEFRCEIQDYLPFKFQKI